MMHSQKIATPANKAEGSAPTAATDKGKAAGNKGKNQVRLTMLTTLTMIPMIPMARLVLNAPHA
jgi:hypothetical protein